MLSEPSGSEVTEGVEGATYRAGRQGVSHTQGNDAPSLKLWSAALKRDQLEIASVNPLRLRLHLLPQSRQSRGGGGGRFSFVAHGEESPRKTRTWERPLLVFSGSPSAPLPLGSSAERARSRLASGSFDLSHPLQRCPARAGLRSDFTLHDTARSTEIKRGSPSGALPSARGRNLPPSLSRDRALC